MATVLIDNYFFLYLSENFIDQTILIDKESKRLPSMYKGIGFLFLFLFYKKFLTLP
jgi:hypothetical protein